MRWLLQIDVQEFEMRRNNFQDIARHSQKENEENHEETLSGSRTGRPPPEYNCRMQPP